MRKSTLILMAVLCLFLGACAGSGSESGPARVPPESGSVLQQAFDSCAGTSPTYAELGDGGDSLIIDGPGESSDELDESITFSACVLNEIKVPDYVISQMDSTTSLMGLREAEWDGIEASWSYHPDNGFDLVLHL